MFFNRRKRYRYNGEVGSLMPVLGIDIEEGGAFQFMQIVDTAWAQKDSAHEAALMAAYSFAVGLYQDGRLERADALVKDKFLPV